jgi:chromosome partitioning protein
MSGEKKYSFVRTRKVMFTNNKGGVGKTTLCFHIGVEIAKKGYSVLLVDLDPQCNLSNIALGDDYYEKEEPKNTIYNVIEPVDIGNGDVNMTIQPIKLPKYENLDISIIPGDLFLSGFETSLQTALSDARSGIKNGYFRTSALQRYINKLSLNNGYDILLIDTGPSLGLLNNVVFLMSDYFVVPMMPDSFSVRGIKNLGRVFTEWKRVWDITARQLAKDQGIASDLILDGKGIFLGYMINSYKSRKGNPIKDQQKWLQEIPNKVKTFLSEKHCRNGLVELSHKCMIGMLKDMGKLAPLAQIENKAMQDITRKEIGDKHYGTIKSQQQGSEDISNLVDEFLLRLSKYE